MSVPLSAPPSTARALATLERERKEEADSRAAVWGFLWTLFAFKILTVGVIWWAATGTGESLAVIAATTWYWLVIPIAAITGPMLVKWRMIKLRKKRQQLLRSEWDVSREPRMHVLHIPDDPDQDDLFRKRA
jgi:hypothetical protein